MICIGVLSGGSPGDALVPPGALALRFPVFWAADVLGLRFHRFCASDALALRLCSETRPASLEPFICYAILWLPGPAGNH